MSIKIEKFKSEWVRGLKIGIKVLLLCFLLRLLFGLYGITVLFMAGMIGENLASAIVSGIFAIIGVIFVPYMIAVISDHVNLDNSSSK